MSNCGESHISRPAPVIMQVMAGVSCVSRLGGGKHIEGCTGALAGDIIMVRMGSNYTGLQSFSIFSPVSWSD